jgi:hypothetical protein
MQYHFHRRDLLIGLSSFLVACPLLPQVGAFKESIRPGYAAGSKVHAFQSWSFIYSFAMGNATGMQRASQRLRQSGLPVLRELHQAGATTRLEPKATLTQSGIQAYAMHWHITGKPTGKKPPQIVTMPGAQGTAPELWHGAAAKVAQSTGLSPQRVEEGHGAWYGLCSILTGLDAEATTLGKHAFALRVLQEQVSAGEKVDWFDPLRPPEETIADTDFALALIADDIDRVRAEQAIILYLTFLANHGDRPGVMAELEKEVDLAESNATEWLASHRQPTPADFGVTYKVPSPELVQEALKEQLGVAGSAVQLARGIATGDLPKTLEGLAGLAPKDTKLKVVADGIAAVSKGDIKGTLSAVAELGGPNTKVGMVAARMESAASLLSLLP